MDSAAHTNESDHIEPTGDPAVPFLLRWGDEESEIGLDHSRPRLVEVAEVLGDSVLEVHHRPVRSARLTLGDAPAPRRPLAAVGAVVGAVAGAALAAGSGGGAAAFAAGALGLAGWLLGQAARARMAQPQDILFDSEALPEHPFPLIDAEGGAARVQLADSWSGTIYRKGEALPLADLLAEGEAQRSGGITRYALKPGEKAIVQTGAGSFFVQQVAAARLVPTSWKDSFDWTFASLFALTGFTAAALSIFVWSTPYDPDQHAVDPTDRFVQLEVAEDLVRPEPEPAVQEVRPEQGTRAPEEAGTIGREDSQLDSTRRERIAINRQQVDRDAALNAGLLAELSGVDHLGIFGDGGLGDGVRNSLGLIGNAYGDQRGAGGQTTYGHGPGGGGGPEGIGGVGTGVRGRGPGGLPGGRGLDRRTAGGPPTSRQGEIMAVGALDASEIDRVVKANLRRIRFCYQRQLQRQPELFGKVVMNWTISASGGVARAQVRSTTLGNETVEQCVATVIRSLRFPEPRGGGVVNVRYPFMFNNGS